MIRLLDKYLFKTLVAVGLVLLILAIYSFIRSLPPEEFTILTGREGGGYHLAAQEYQKIAARNGFKLNIQPTAGSVETLRMLEEGKADVGFVQGGIALDGNPAVVSSMASVYYEPVWIFFRPTSFDDHTLKRLTELKGKRIAIGEKGSGVHVLATKLLDDNGIGEADAMLERLSSDDAVRMLKAGELDAAFFVTSEKSAAIQDLLYAPGVELMDMERATSYAARYMYLKPVMLPQGALDLVKNLPPENKHLVATTANLVIRNDMHSDLVRLLAIAAVQVHAGGGMFGARDEFPSTKYTDLPMERRGRAYLERIKNGESTLDNYLPFFWAAIADRYMLFFLPFVFLALPIITRIPLLYTAWNRYKVNRWYKGVRATELQLDQMDLYQVRQEIARLQALDDKLTANTNVSAGYLPAAYDLHIHLEYVLRKLVRREQSMLDSEPKPDALPAAHRG